MLYIQCTNRNKPVLQISTIEAAVPCRSTVPEPSSNKPDPLENLSEPAENKQNKKWALIRFNPLNWIQSIQFKLIQSIHSIRFDSVEQSKLGNKANLKMRFNRDVIIHFLVHQTGDRSEHGLFVTTCILLSNRQSRIEIKQHKLSWSKWRGERTKATNSEEAIWRCAKALDGLWLNKKFAAKVLARTQLGSLPDASRITALSLPYVKTLKTRRTRTHARIWSNELKKNTCCWAGKWQMAKAYLVVVGIDSGDAGVGGGPHWISPSILPRLSYSFHGIRQFDSQRSWISNWFLSRRLFSPFRLPIYVSRFIMIHLFANCDLCDCSTNKVIWFYCWFYHFYKNYQFLYQIMFGFW